MPYRFLLGMAICPNSREAYFTDGSSIYGPEDYLLSIQSGDSTGRLLKYDPVSREVTELLRNLSGPVGLECSADDKYLLISEFIVKRIQKYWLAGEEAGTNAIIKNFSGNPSLIKRNKSGDYWVALNFRTNNSTGSAPRGVKINSDRKVLNILNLSKQYNKLVTTVHEHYGNLYVGSRHANFVGVYENTKP